MYFVRIFKKIVRVKTARNGAYTTLLITDVVVLLKAQDHQYPLCGLNINCFVSISYQNKTFVVENKKNQILKTSSSLKVKIQNHLQFILEGLSVGDRLGLFNSVDIVKYGYV